MVRTATSSFNNDFKMIWRQYLRKIMIFKFHLSTFISTLTLGDKVYCKYQLG